MCFCSATASPIQTNSTSSFYINGKGELWVWGNNGNGQLGTGDKINVSTPTKINNSTNWQQVFEFSGYVFATKKRRFFMGVGL